MSNRYLNLKMIGYLGSLSFLTLFQNIIAFSFHCLIVEYPVKIQTKLNEVAVNYQRSSDLVKPGTLQSAKELE